MLYIDGLSNRRTVSIGIDLCNSQATPKNEPFPEKGPTDTLPLLFTIVLETSVTLSTLDELSRKLYVNKSPAHKLKAWVGLNSDIASEERAKTILGSPAIPSPRQTKSHRLINQYCVFGREIKVTSF